MKTIKEIKVDDCVECYVSDTCTPSNEDIVTFIIGHSGGIFTSINGHRWKYAIPCEQLDNPPKTKWSDKYPKEWSIDAKVFKALNEGAVIMRKTSSPISNYWHTTHFANEHFICTNYTGTSTDVWEEIE
jgi:hypothetical protein